MGIRDGPLYHLRSRVFQLVPRHAALDVPGGVECIVHFAVVLPPRKSWSKWMDFSSTKPGQPKAVSTSGGRWRKLSKRRNTVDRPFAWRIGNQSDVSVACPHCHHGAPITNAGISGRTLKVEALCVPCGRYFYYQIAINPNSLQQRGKKCTITTLTPTTSPGAA